MPHLQMATQKSAEQLRRERQQLRREKKRAEWDSMTPQERSNLALGRIVVGIIMIGVIIGGPVLLLRGCFAFIDANQLTPETRARLAREAEEWQMERRRRELAEKVAEELDRRIVDLIVDETLPR